MNNEPPQRGTALPGCSHRSEEHRSQCQVLISRLRENQTVVSTELQQRSPHAPSDSRSDAPSHRRAAGRGNEGEARVFGHPFPHFALADDQAEDAGITQRPHHFLHEVLHGNRGQRSEVRRLPDACVSADGSQHGVPGPDRDRKIEGRDDANRPQRMPLLQHPMIGPLTGNRQAIELPRQPHGIVAHVDHFLDFARSLAADLADLQRDQQSQILLVPPQCVPNQPHHLAPSRRRQQSPGLE